MRLFLDKRQKDNLPNRLQLGQVVSIADKLANLEQVF